MTIKTSGSPFLDAIFNMGFRALEAPEDEDYSHESCAGRTFGNTWVKVYYTENPNVGVSFYFAPNNDPDDSYHMFDESNHKDAFTVLKTLDKTLSGEVK